jgi:long-chain acyl-CoA synthetase
LKPQIFVSVPRLWNRIYDRVMTTMREANPVKRRLFETAFAYKRAALEAGEARNSSIAWGGVLY